MKKDFKNIFINFFGVYFILLAILAIFIVTVLYPIKSQQAFWLCYIGTLLIGIGILTRKTFIIAAALEVIAIPQIGWIIDFISYFFIKGGLFGMAGYVFNPATTLISNFVSFGHIYTVPISVFILYLIAGKNKSSVKGSWKFAAIIALAYFVICRIFTNSYYNVNCVYKTCIYFTIPYIPYILTWFIIVGGMITVSYILLLKSPQWIEKLNKYWKKNIRRK